jgi:hypothetical protein
MVHHMKALSRQLCRLFVYDPFLHTCIHVYVFHHLFLLPMIHTGMCLYCQTCLSFIYPCGLGIGIVGLHSPIAYMYMYNYTVAAK